MQLCVQGQGRVMPSPERGAVWRESRFEAPPGEGFAPATRRRALYAEPEPAPLVALGTSAAETGRLIAGFLPLLREGRRLYCLDGGNTFNPYRLAALARQQGLDPGAMLERVFISRAYTCHQLAAAAESMLAPLADEATPPLVGILGIERLFLDDDVPLYERRHLFEQLLVELDRLHGCGLPIFITFLSEPGNPWVRRLAKMTSVLPDLNRALANFRERLPHGTHAAHLQYVPGA